MIGLPAPIRDALAAAVGTTILAATPVSGGMIAQAARVETSGGPIFIKWKADAPPGFFAAEADGLRRLGEANALRVPAVLAYGDTPAFLALEWIEERPAAKAARFAERFGEGLAALHQNTPPDNTFGLDRDNFLGRFPQNNTPAARWPDFYRDCRLLPQIALARRLGHLPPERERQLMQVVERLDTRLGDRSQPQPALLHSDLWSGNFLSSGDEPVLLDPAVYYGDREMEIAFMELFGGFSDGVFWAYRAAFALPGGYAERRPLHQLYPLLVHLNHFGETYGPRVDAVCRRYAG